MKNLIYQYWDGELFPGVKAGSQNMEAYAKRIGADYLFEHNPKFVTNLGPYSPHYGSFKPVYDEKFHVYDNVLFTDTDVFAVHELEENIFEYFSGLNAELGICTEPFQPQARKKKLGRISSAMDEQWAALIETQWRVLMPRTPEGLIKVFNSGVVLYSNQGLQNAKKQFVPFQKYVRLIKSKRLHAFYTSDQGYLHAMLKVANMNYVEMDNGWNSYVHYLGKRTMKQRPVNDMRTKDTKFVHIQLSSADHFDADALWRVTNLPVSQWRL